MEIAQCKIAIAISNHKNSLLLGAVLLRCGFVFLPNSESTKATLRRFMVA
jgi:hypothetical protein